jgi:protein TonB
LPPDAAVLPVPPPSGRSSAPTPREVVRPLLIPESKVEPRFPPVARALRARGTVEIEVRVGVGGSVLEARVVECTRPGVGFEEAALEAVRQWSFRPGRLGYEPVEATTLVRVEFR